ncbi:MAG TPA: hypothetical protein H9742_11850 [Candidatus Acetatifactor stercoripullorum]|mgnify:CR=1 FL=1|uniref:Uncharacterized protein n=1 Tax=Candidatus Acetatifactor stercoripullorum TaxID=2838414 RepID=A0A9D1R6Z3_9FIRM|nr:hypothetical protein [Candidatus Acetatifactor stercoripullorum]HIW82187.1 hypothetical protein [Candidatus Acetatifactor stercoripullorum]
MLNEERIILMTKMASYEQNEGRENVAIGRYFRSDYIGLQVLKSIFCATVAFAIIFALFVFYDFEIFMQDIYNMNLIEFAQTVLLYYGITVAGYGVISYILYSYRYSKAKKSLKCYYHNLKKLNSLYNE